MLDLKFMMQNTPLVLASLQKRGNQKALEALTRLTELDQRRREMIQEVEALKAQRNQASSKIAELKKNKQDDSAILEQMKTVSTTIKSLDAGLEEVQAEVTTLCYEIPNVLDESVPEGLEANQNISVKEWGQKPIFDFKPKGHDEIGEALGILDFKKAGVVTGARFVFLKGRAAQLERALIMLMMDTHQGNGYEEMIPPFIVNRASLTGTGQLPKFEEDVFQIEKVDYFLIPTAEVPVTNYHRDEILSRDRLPIKYCAYSPCFRSEAGSYGKDTKGLKRQHQFNKVELVQFVEPESSMQALEDLLGDAERILQLLKLSYRVVKLCAGDTSFSSSKTYDIEVWSPAQNAYMEISSCSNFKDYQARRANIRYRDATDKVQFVHTLNGSGLAVGRTLIAIIENYQTADGNFQTPAALKPYIP